MSLKTGIGAFSFVILLAPPVACTYAPYDDSRYVYEARVTCWRDGQVIFDRVANRDAITVSSDGPMVSIYERGKVTRERIDRCTTTNLARRLAQ